MNKKKICAKVKESIRKVDVFSNEDVISAGTGVLINPSGFLLTANHVISCLDTNSTIIVSGGTDNKRIKYEPFFFDVSVDINMEKFLKPVNIDLAILKPVLEIKTENYLNLNKRKIKEGEEVIMAGFPDDIKPPLNFDKLLNFENLELGVKKNEIKSFFENFLRFLMIRHGIIGSVQKVNINTVFEEKKLEIKGATYWIDNAVTYGASGGPVVNSSGDLIGIISEKGVTDGVVDSEKLIPSGSTMALSHELITWRIDL